MRLQLTALIGAILFMHGAAVAQTATQEEWRIDPLRGPVDLGLTDPSLVGAIDVHLHLDPDSPGAGGVVRAIDVLDAARIAIARGMRGFIYQDPSGHEFGERRLHGAHARVADLRGVRPHGVELFDRRHQCRNARALHADQGRMGPHL